MTIYIEQLDNGSYQSIINGVASNPFVSADCSTVIWNVCKTITQTGCSCCTHKIIFKHGIYHLFPYRINGEDGHLSDGHPYGIPFYINNNKNVLIEGNGSTFICHGQMGFALLEFSDEVLMQNMNIDWERPYVIQATVIEHNNEILKIEIDSSKYDIGTASGNLHLRAEPYDAYEGCSLVNYIAIHDNCNVFDGYGNMLQELRDSDVGFIFENGTADEEGILGNIKTVTFTVGGTNNNLLPIGSQIIIHVAAIANDENSRLEQINVITINHGWKTTLRNIHIFHSTCRGIFAHNTGRRWNGTTYDNNSGFIHLDNCHAMVKPGSGRCFSTLYDNAHFCNCAGQITIENCHLSGMGDDGINIHGRYYQVIYIDEEDNTQVRVEAEDMQPEVGDMMQVVGRCSLERNEVNDFFVVSSQVTNPNDNPKVYQLSLNRTLSGVSHIYDLMENMTWTPNVTIRNCVFEKRNRARAVLVSTPGTVLITDNVFHSAGAAILIAADYFRYKESGGVKDIEISNNTFTECATSVGDVNHAGDWGRAAITIEPETTAMPITDQGICPTGIVHENINIHNNTFYMHDVPILFARAVNGLTFKDNYVWRSLPPQYAANMAAQQVAFRLEGVTGWSETGTKWSFDYPDNWKVTGIV